jgi:hypothetical protein
MNVLLKIMLYKMEYLHGKQKVTIEGEEKLQESLKKENPS